MITLDDDVLSFRFPDIHEHAHTEIRFQRTLRIPDDGNEYPLPPGLGPFALRHLDDFAKGLPALWRERGGVMMPLYQAEAMWIAFAGSGRWSGDSYPCAIKIAAGKINAISGKPWKPELDASERDYIVVPEQPWIDGFCIAKDVIRQFVAMPLGSGYSVEEQMTGKAEHGGLQLIVYPMKAACYEGVRRKREQKRRLAMHLETACAPAMAPVAQAPPRRASPAPRAMALAAGGRMRQQIYADPHGVEAWEQSTSSRCFVTLLDAVQWLEVTGKPPGARPPTASDYAAAGLPWFDYYAADLETLAGAPALTMVKGINELAAEKGEEPFDAGGKVHPGPIVALGPGGVKPTPPRAVREHQV